MSTWINRIGIVLVKGGEGGEEESVKGVMNIISVVDVVGVTNWKQLIVIDSICDCVRSVSTLEKGGKQSLHIEHALQAHYCLWQGRRRHG